MSFKSITIDSVMPQIVKKDNDFVVFMSGFLGRNIQGYEFPEFAEEKEKKNIVKLLTPFISKLSVIDKVIDLSRNT
jgi:protein-arginine kinase